MRIPNLAMPNYLAAPKGEERRRSTAVLSHCTLQPRRDWLARFGEVGEVGTRWPTDTGNRRGEA
jgi:hypothetical protein